MKKQSMEAWQLVLDDAIKNNRKKIRILMLSLIVQLFGVAILFLVDWRISIGLFLWQIGENIGSKYK